MLLLKQLKEGVRMKPILYFVVPCFNEEAVLPVTIPMFLGKLKELSEAGRVSEKSRILFVDDGSKDATWELIEKLHKENSPV